MWLCCHLLQHNKHFWVVLNETLRCIHIGLLCVQGSPNARPLVSSIVSFL
uniref:S-locus receptor kinase C-terminal domain-containing protein n=1 Tax=Aegilops tauschii subsp. strangulata TaxID=200361 RepID=A0A453Q1Z2_AEGTS